MYGLVNRKKPLNETTPFHPRSVYGVSKVFAYHAAVHYREAYGILHLTEFYLTTSLLEEGQLLLQKNSSRACKN